MFNTIERAQGWSDTPLTEAGERGIRELGLGLKEAGFLLKEAVSVILDATIQTMGIILRELGRQEKSLYRYDKRSVNGVLVVLTVPDGDLFYGVLPCL